MSVSVKNLQAFVCIAESSNFAEAADKLHVTQPALSSSIKKMEEQLGGKLFSRSTRRVALTPEGETLLPNAKRLLNDWQETFQDVENLFAMRQGKLTIAAMPSFADSKLPALIKKYHHRYPNIRLRLLDVVMEDVIDNVLNGHAELGFTFEPESMDGLRFLPLYDDHFICVVSASHPLVDNGTVTWRDVVRQNFVAMNRGSAVRQWTETSATKYGQLNIIAETGQLNSLGQLIAQGLGISVVPGLCRKQMENKGLVCLPFAQDEVNKRVGVISSSRTNLSVAAESLWHMCQRIKYSPL